MNNNHTIVTKYSKRLKELRKKNGLTQEKLAEISGVSYKNIQYLEAKKPTCPSLITISKIAKAFNLPLSKFFDFK